MTHKLPLIGRDRVLIENLAKDIHRYGIRRGELTPLHDRADGRGFEFRVLVATSDGKLTNRIARVEISFDGIHAGPEEAD
jgi:hypothetical protein